MEPERARELLARERQRIERILAGGRQDGAETDSSEGSDGGAGLLEAGVEEGVAEQLRDELEAIERAETRLAEGTYGLSVVSGEPIPDARLEAIPWADRTVDEQSQLRG